MAGVHGTNAGHRVDETSGHGVLPGADSTLAGPPSPLDRARGAVSVVEPALDSAPANPSHRPYTLNCKVVCDMLTGDNEDRQIHPSGADRGHEPVLAADQVLALSA